MPNIKWLRYKGMEIWRSVHVFFCINKQLHEIVSEANAPLSDLERKSTLYREYWSSIMGKATKGTGHWRDSVSVPKGIYTDRGGGR